MNTVTVHWTVRISLHCSPVAQTRRNCLKVKLFPVVFLPDCQSTAGLRAAPDQSAPHNQVLSPVDPASHVVEQLGSHRQQTELNTDDVIPL